MQPLKSQIIPKSSDQQIEGTSDKKTIALRNSAQDDNCDAKLTTDDFRKNLLEKYAEFVGIDPNQKQEVLGEAFYDQHSPDMSGIVDDNNNEILTSPESSPEQKRNALSEIAFKLSDVELGNVNAGKLAYTLYSVSNLCREKKIKRADYQHFIDELKKRGIQENDIYNARSIHLRFSHALKQYELSISKKFVPKYKYQ